MTATGDARAEATTGDRCPSGARVELYWLPLGAGGAVVRWNGWVFEALSAALRGRPRCDLYHCGLVVTCAEGRFVVELAPVVGAPDGDHGVVRTGPVGARWAGRSRWFRYEVRCWRDGAIPDVGYAVGGPHLLSTDELTAAGILAAAGQVPALVWGRDESGAGEMWNSNSVISWALELAGIDSGAVPLPAGGRAPGWDAGAVIARRSMVTPRGR